MAVSALAGSRGPGELPRVHGVLLDVDGTLVDSNDAHARAWAEACARHGHPVPRAAVRMLIGMGADQLLPHLAGIDAESAVGKAIAETRATLFREMLPTLHAFPHARDLVLHMHRLGHRLVVASSATKDELTALLDIAGVGAVLDGVTSADDVDRSKPQPDVIEVALERVGVPRAAVLLIGDTPYDVIAGERAGVGTIALRCGGWQDVMLEGALAVYDDPADLLAHYDLSPLGARARLAPSPSVPTTTG